MAAAVEKKTPAKRVRRARAPKQDRAVIQTQALQNALSDRSAANYETIFEEFAQRGIPVEEISPRENVFTYHAWLALGRQVRGGEKGVKIFSMKPSSKRGAGDEPAGAEGAEEGKPRMVPVAAYVFHISQTDPVQK